ncbi:MAG: 4-alpha-glucanotransferase [Gammaproteobacteria bacterium]|nr:4-alpha-glucanotransferase [Gammaproteobacteria bacterium]MCP5426138.1 4-alpha-glucanotransferase [Gammaproteobacteria bacterium]
MESHFEPAVYRQCINEGLRRLGVDNLFLQIHDPSFPCHDDEDIGRGSPYTRGASRFLEDARNLGFNGLQLGPQGATSATNPSPYDGTLFSRNPLSISLSALCDQGVLKPEELHELLTARPKGRNRVHHRFAFDTATQALDFAYDRFCRLRDRGRATGVNIQWRLLDFWKANRDWLERDALYGALCRLHGVPNWQEWQDESGGPHPDQRLWNPAPGEELPMHARLVALIKLDGEGLERFVFIQLMAHEQHYRLRELCGRLGLQLFADLQVGMSHQDAWSYGGLCLQSYRMGAPPSRTNPEGQPWGFMMLDPGQYFTGEGQPGPVLRFVQARLRKMHAEYDGLRIDHPQGWVCPWVYRTDIVNPFQAVQNGGRLFSSPDLSDHPLLEPFSLVAPDQLNRKLPRHADHWVQHLTDEQVGRYATLFEQLSGGEGGQRVMCEVLSTMPYPLRRVMERYGLGRFRVLQNANPNDPLDVYRSDNARPADWIMLGNHDTRPIWNLAQHWCTSGQSYDRAADLSRRLVPDESRRADWIEQAANRPGLLVHALFADMLLSQARNVMVFVSDMLGIKERYNSPGTISDDNWSLRVQPNFERSYLARVARDEALSLPYAMLLAFQAQPGQVDENLVRAMETEVERLRAIGRAIPDN